MLLEDRKYNKFNLLLAGPSSTALKNQTIEDLFHMAKDTNLYGEEMNEESLMFLLGKVVYNSSAMG